MGLFKSKAEKELDLIIENIEMNMSNNYKDAAQSSLRDYEAYLKKAMETGALKEKVATPYTVKLDMYKQKLKGYTHKDQQATWN